MISDQTVGNILHRHALPPAPQRKRTTTWPDFIRIHSALLAGTDFFTAEVLTLRGLVTYYVLFFHLESRRVDIAGITMHPDEAWTRQIARNVTMEGYGRLRDCRYLLHDRDTKYIQSFRAIIVSGRVESLVLPAHIPNLNAYAERWVRSPLRERPYADYIRVFLRHRHELPDGERRHIVGLSRKYQKLVNQIFADGVASGEFRSDLNVEYAAFALRGLCNSVISSHVWLRSADIEKIIDEYTAIIVGGVRSRRHPTSLAEIWVS